jgi:ABC-type branched-subunit amino acid transport system ATPase component
VPPRALKSIIGPNGAGKTTLFNLLSGQYRASAGRISFKGEDITAWNAARRTRAGIGRSFQLTNIFATLSVLENVRIALQARAVVAPDQPRRDFKQLVQHYDELTAHQARWKTKLKARLRLQGVIVTGERLFSSSGRKAVLTRALTRQLPDARESLQEFSQTPGASLLRWLENYGS